MLDNESITFQLQSEEALPVAETDTSHRPFACQSHRPRCRSSLDGGCGLPRRGGYGATVYRDRVDHARIPHRHCDLQNSQNRVGVIDNEH